MEAAIITTYRCQNRCRMCNIWNHPTREDEEFKPGLLEKLPNLVFCNITGGEPFLRADLEEIVRIVHRKAQRIVISTNGYLTDQIVALAGRFPDIGIRISIEGLPAANDELRGMKDGFDHGLRTLLSLQRMKIKDIGFGITVSDRNASDMLELYQLARNLGVEFATAAVHNSYYFHTSDNAIHRKPEVIESFRILISELLRTWKPKNWYRAYFNHGLINYIEGKPRLLPCRAGEDMFFLDPWGELRPCNGMEKGIWYESFGNLHDADFTDIWNSAKAREIREMVHRCPKNCWMIGTASPAIKRSPLPPSLWVIRHKLKSIFKRI